MFGGPLSFFQKWRKRREKQQSILSKKTRTQGKCGVGKKGTPLARFPSALWKVHFGAAPQVNGRTFRELLASALFPAQPDQVFLNNFTCRGFALFFFSLFFRVTFKPSYIYLKNFIFGCSGSLLCGLFSIVSGYSLLVGGVGFSLQWL